MTIVDWAPFVVVFLLGAAAGACLTGRLAWVAAVFLPAAHLVVSITTGRAAENFLDYVLPVNMALLTVAVIGLLQGRWLRRRRLNR